ncbi:MAG TPA: Fur family transcriptional regulator [Polyangiaceae bacterium]|nr:Fur family transcriptional regulator [Polyangiaceae bacterium]
MREEDVERALVRFRAVLHERSLKLSSVREAIVRAALARDGHFTVEELSKDLRSRGVLEAHVATVYRAIPLLVEAGLIQATMLSRGNEHHYEVAFEREHHDHLVCKLCGKVVEFHSEALEALQREIASRYGFVIDEHVHELLGRCGDCQVH